MNDKKPEGETLDKPVLDGAEEGTDDSIDPRKGQEDPALIRHHSEGEKTIAPYNLGSAD